MSVERRTITVAVALVIAAILQMTWPNAMQIGTARPDFILATLAAISITVNLPGGAIAGVWAGMLMTSVTGVNYGSFLVSRALAGTFCGWAVRWPPLQPWPIGVPVLGIVATLAAETFYYLMAPTHRSLWWVEHMALEAVYNAVISLPIAILLMLTGLRRPKVGAFD